MVPPPAYPPPGYQRGGDQNEGLIVVAVLAAILIVAVGSLGVLLVLMTHRAPAPTLAARPTPTPGPVTRTTQLASGTGDLLYKDDFHDPGSGWDHAGAGVNYAYSNGKLVVVAKGYYLYYQRSAYLQRSRQLSVSVTGRMDLHVPRNAGFGSACVRGDGTAAPLIYEFLADADGNWEVSTSVGFTSTSFSTTLAHGWVGSAVAPGVLVTLVGVCATLSDGQTTRLVFFVDGTKVADIVARNSIGAGNDWEGDLLTAGSASGAVTVTVTRFELRDVSRSGP